MALIPNDGRVPSFFEELLVKFAEALWMCTDKALLGDDGCLGGEVLGLMATTRGGWGELFSNCICKYFA